MKMVTLKSKAIDKDVSKNALGAPELSTNNDGADLHLEGEHMKQMGVDDGLPHGHNVTVQAHGTVHRSESGPEGGRMHIKLHKMGMEYDEPHGKREGSIRDDIKDSASKSDRKSESDFAKREFKKVDMAKKADATGDE